MAKDKLLFRKGVLITIMTAVMIGLLFIILKTYTGQAGYILQTQKGYFPENLVNWYQVVPGAFIDFPFLTSQAIKITGLSFQTIMKLLEYFNVVSIFILLILFIYGLLLKKSFREFNSGKLLVLIAVATSAATFLSLGWLSFTFQKQQGFINDWNYIYEARYYALVSIMLQLGFLGWIFLSEKWKRSVWQKTIILLGSVLLFIEVSHSIYFQTKVAFNFNEYKSAVYREQDYNYFNILLPTLKKDYPNYEILVAAPGDDFYTYTAIYYGHKGVFAAENIKKQLPDVKIKSLLLVMLYADQLDNYQNFISNTGVKKIKQVDYSNFYLAELLP
jgi:hypothetical protein